MNFMNQLKRLAADLLKFGLPATLAVLFAFALLQSSQPQTTPRTATSTNASISTTTNSVATISVTPVPGLPAQNPLSTSSAQETKPTSVLDTVKRVVAGAFKWMFGERSAHADGGCDGVNPPPNIDCPDPTPTPTATPDPHS